MRAALAEVDRLPDVLDRTRMIRSKKSLKEPGRNALGRIIRHYGRFFTSVPRRPSSRLREGNTPSSRLLPGRPDRSGYGAVLKYEG